MNVLSLFAGIGGLDLGLEWAGFRTVAFVEREAACKHWLGQHWPGVPIHDDVRTFSGLPFRGLVDLLCGGFPCQPFSVAGKQKGTEDERHLWPEMSRIIREVRPRWVLAENVPGLRTIAADLVLEDLEGQGYTCWPLVVGVDDVGGPHRRKRVWILAYRDGGGCEGERCGRLLDGERAAFGHDTHGRGGSWGQRPDAGQPQESEPRHPMRWPSRPGEPQHHWEAPRLAHTANHRRNGRTRSGAAGRNAEAGHGTRPEGGSESELADREGIGLEGRPEGERPKARPAVGRGSSSDGMADSPSEPPRSPGQPRREPDTRESESPVGGSVDGLPDGLAGLGAPLTSAHRREALKALGNAVCPVNAYYIGRAIMNVERAA